MGNLMLLLGGARSGKSAFAVETAKNFKAVVYYTTAFRSTGDAELESRIERHAKERPAHWKTLEPPTSLQELKQYVLQNKTELVVVDCATLWLGWVLTESFSQYTKAQLAVHLEKECEFFLQTLQQLPCAVVVVSNEVGNGVVPSAESGRLFRDALGSLNMKAAQLANVVVHHIAGISMAIKDLHAPFAGPVFVSSSQLAQKCMAGK